MVPTEPESLRAFVDAIDTRQATLLLVNRTEPAPLVDLLTRAFDRQPVHVVEREVPGPVENRVLLLDQSGLVATSTLEDLAESFLLINADRFRTGANDLAEAAVPAVLRELTEIPFELRGYPASAKEKLLLIAMSRHVEARALSAGAGELHAGFQHLARLDDEYGTREVYRRLGESAVDTHVYGVGNDADCPDVLTVHADDGEEYRRSWFLTFESPERGADAALVAWEVEDNVWDGAWTFDEETVAAVGNYLRTSI